MGASCSIYRQRAMFSQEDDDGAGVNRDGYGMCPADGSPSSSGRRAVRHSVDSQVPDRSIASLYPLRDNYVLVPGNCRSPKSLSELCLDAVCRSLPDMEGELPPGLPQNIVDSIVKSLINHSALNATTLRALRRCEIGELSLAGCRGVGDDWLKTFNEPVHNSGMSCAAAVPYHQICQEEHHTGASAGVYTDRMELDVVQERDNLKEAHDDASCSSSSFVSASSTGYMNMPCVQSDMDTSEFSTPQPYAQGAAKLYAVPSQADVPAITSQLTFLDLSGSQRLTDRGLLQLGELNALEVCKLDDCHAIAGRGLLVFASSVNLHTLSLANCRRLTDEAIINVSHLTSLRALILDGCRCITDRSLVAIADLCQLRKLDLSQCDLITNDGLENLNDLRQIEELSLGWCRRITDDGLIMISSQPLRSECLKVLRIARCPVTDRGIGSLTKLSNLHELNINGCSNITSAALGKILEKLQLEVLDASYCPSILRSSWQSKIKNLKTLELCYSGVRDAHLSHFSSLPALEEINLDSCPVGDWAIAHLTDNNVTPNLTALNLADTDLTDLGMVHLPKFTKMKRLSLFYCNISNTGLQYLASMPNLEVLNLDSREIGDDGLLHLQGLKNLKALDVFSGRITDAGCSYLAKIKSLESLELCGGGVGDFGCAYLASLDNLTSLNLSQNERITNRGAASLAALTNLKALNLSNTKVTSAALRFLGGLLKLQSLAMYGCRGIDNSDGLHALQQELPSLRCLRLNSASDNDGVVDTANLEDDGSSSDYEEDVEDLTLMEVDEEVAVAAQESEIESFVSQHGHDQGGFVDVEEGTQDDNGIEMRI